MRTFFIHILDVTNTEQYKYEANQSDVGSLLVRFLMARKGVDVDGKQLNFHKRYGYQCKYLRCGKPLNLYEYAIEHSTKICISSSPYEIGEKHPKRINTKLAWIKQFKIHNTPSDGNCFFHAVVQSLYCLHFDKILSWNNIDKFDPNFNFELNQTPPLPRFITVDGLLRKQAPDQLRILIGYYLIKFYGFWDKQLNASEYVDTWFDAEFTSNDKKFVQIKPKVDFMKTVTIPTDYFTESLRDDEFAEIPDALLEGVGATILGKSCVRTPSMWGGDQILTLFINNIFGVNVIQYDEQTINNLFETNGYADPVPEGNIVILYRRKDHYFWLEPKKDKIV